MITCGDGREGGKQLQPITRMELLRRIDFAADVMLSFHRRADQIAAITAEFGVQWRQASRYLKRARERILEASKRSQDTYLADSLEFYESICRNPFHPVKDRLRARQLLDRAVGVGVGAYQPDQSAAALSPAEQATIIAAANAARADRLKAAVSPPQAPPEPVPETEPAPATEGV